MINYTPPIAVEYRSGLTPFEPKIIESLAVLNKIPSSFLEILSSSNVRIVYYNGAVTQFPEFKSLARNKRNDIHGYPGYTNNLLGGLCVSPGRNSPLVNVGDVYVGVHGDYFTKDMMTIEEVTIHELGHSIDHVVGRALFGEKLSSRWKFRKFKEKVGLDRKDNRKEHFAWFFDWRYLKEKRGKLSSTYYPQLERMADEYCASRNIST